MDHTRDNPLKRFTAFWVALVLITAFGIAGIIIGPMFGGEKEDPAYAAKLAERLAIRSEVDYAQNEALNSSALDKAITAQSKSLLESKPARSKRPVPAPAPAEKPAK